MKKPTDAVPLIFILVLVFGYVAFRAFKPAGFRGMPKTPVSDVVPVQVEYNFYPQSEIRDANLIQLQGVRLFKRQQHSMYYYQVVNKATATVSAAGDIYFYDAEGREIYKDLDRGNGSSELFGQAEPGESETGDVSADFFKFDLGKISKARVIIRAAAVDTADRE